MTPPKPYAGSLEANALNAAKKAFAKKAPGYWLDVRDADLHLSRSLEAAILAYLNAIEAGHEKP